LFTLQTPRVLELLEHAALLTGSGRNIPTWAKQVLLQSQGDTLFAKAQDTQESQGWIGIRILTAIEEDICALIDPARLTGLLKTLPRNSEIYLRNRTNRTTGEKSLVVQFELSEFEVPIYDAAEMPELLEPNGQVFTVDLTNLITALDNTLFANESTDEIHKHWGNEFAILPTDNPNTSTLRIAATNSKTLAVFRLAIPSPILEEGKEIKPFVLPYLGLKNLRKFFLKADQPIQDDAKGGIVRVTVCPHIVRFALDDREIGITQNQRVFPRFEAAIPKPETVRGKIFIDGNDFSDLVDKVKFCADAHSPGITFSATPQALTVTGSTNDPHFVGKSSLPFQDANRLEGTPFSVILLPDDLQPFLNQLDTGSKIQICFYAENKAIQFLVEGQNSVLLISACTRQ